MSARMRNRERDAGKTRLIPGEKSRQGPFMPKSKAIGAISETIVLTSTPTSRSPCNFLSPPFTRSLRASLSAPVPSYLNSRISASLPLSQFHPPSAASSRCSSRFYEYSWSAALVSRDAYPPSPWRWLMIMAGCAKPRLSSSSSSRKGEKRERRGASI